MKRKVFSLTDVSTPVLEQQGLAQLTLVLGDILLPPGACVEADVNEAMLAAQLEYVLRVGAVALDVLPPEYVAAKHRAPAPPPAAPPPAEHPTE